MFHCRVKSSEHEKERCCYGFTEYMRKNIEEEHIEENTRTRKLYMVETIEKFGRINTFADITAENILAYEKFLHKGNRTDATVFSYHKRLKFYINQAMRLKSWHMCHFFSLKGLCIQ